MSTKITREPFGTYDDGRTVYCYKLEDEKGQYVTIMNIGCTLLDIWVLDRDGKLRDVNLGMPSYDAYHKARSFMGSTIGRCTNRIADGRFVLNGKEYQLDKNERGINHLHGGKTGFQMRYWEGSVEGDVLTFRYESADGEEGYPGNMTVTETVTFRDGRLHLTVSGVCDQDTLFNITNHAFFNLNGQESGAATEHQLVIHAEQFCEVNEKMIPCRAVSVEGTPFDFRTPHTIGERIHSDWKQISDVHGYDVNYILASNQPAAVAVGDQSGIRMAVYTNCPDMQLYTGNALGMPFLCHGKREATYVNYSGFCLEPHWQPDAINTPEAHQVILPAGEKREWHMELAFDVEK